MTELVPNKSVAMQNAKIEQAELLKSLPLYH
jgi:hypothetical protein